LLGVNASVSTILLAVLTSIVGALCLAVAVQGWLLCKTTIIERLGYGAIAWLMLDPNWKTDIIGFSLLAALVAYQARFKKSEPIESSQET
jgi:TRAP-type uncharacterized transport system fused permease subunit